MTTACLTPSFFKRLIAVAAVALSLAPARAPAPRMARAAPALAVGMVPVQAAPGSVQDFAQNVGDRIFFETDSVE